MDTGIIEVDLLFEDLSERMNKTIENYKTKYNDKDNNKQKTKS